MSFLTITATNMNMNNEAAQLSEPDQSFGGSGAHAAHAGAGESTLGSNGSFDYLTLALFAERPQAATQLLRSQHSELQLAFERLRALAEGGAEQAHAARVLMTKIVANVQVTLQLEQGVLGKQVAGDPRTRALFDQFQRELAPARGMMNEWARAYPTPSTIAANATEYRASTERVLRVLEERFRHVQRDLYVECDRVIVQ